MQQNHRDRLERDHCSYYYVSLKLWKKKILVVIIDMCGGNHYDNFVNLYDETVYNGVYSFENILKFVNILTILLRYFELSM